MTTLADAFREGVRWREDQANNGIVREDYIAAHNPYKEERMTEQQYRVVADRDKGDDPQPSQIKVGDRIVYSTRQHGDDGEPTFDRLVRIERPVPTTDEPTPIDTIALRGIDMDAVYGIVADIRNGEHLTWEDGWDESNAQLLESALRRIPSVLTREQIAEAIREALDAGYGIIASGDMDEAVANVLALLNGADRG